MVETDNRTMPTTIEARRQLHAISSYLCVANCKDRQKMTRGGNTIRAAARMQPRQN
jgi:hypothetical protein